MKIPILLAALVLPLPLRAQISADQATLARVEPIAANWLEWRTRSEDMESAFRAKAAASDNPGYYQGCPDWIDQAVVNSRRRFNDWLSSKTSSWRAQVTAGIMTPDESERRTSYAQRIYRVRLLTLYGNLVPRTIDSCVDEAKGGPGRVWAGPAWSIAASKNDLETAEYELVRESGLGDEAFTH
jgi:hypothetical protein